MPIQFQCPGCKKVLAVGDENAGHQAKCPHCELVSLVPDSSTPIYDAETVGGGSEESAGPTDSPFGATGQPGVNQPGSSSPFGTPSPVSYEPINSHLVDAILVTLCCCLPFGIVGIVYAAMCKSQLGTGNYALAKEYSRKAHMWNMIGLALGLCGNAIAVGLQFLAAAWGAR